MDSTDNYTVADISLAKSGSLRVDWARARMPVLAALKEEALKTGLISEREYMKIMNPKKMVKPG